VHLFFNWVEKKAPILDICTA